VGRTIVLTLLSSGWHRRFRRARQHMMRATANDRIRTLRSRPRPESAVRQPRRFARSCCHQSAFLTRGALLSGFVAWRTGMGGSTGPSHIPTTPFAPRTGCGSYGTAGNRSTARVFRNDARATKMGQCESLSWRPWRPCFSSCGGNHGLRLSAMDARSFATSVTGSSTGRGRVVRCAPRSPTHAPS